MLRGLFTPIQSLDVSLVVLVNLEHWTFVRRFLVSKSFSKFEIPVGQPCFTVGSNDFLLRRVRPLLSGLIQ